MLRRLTILAVLAVLTVAAGTALSATAQAVGHTICVGSPVGACDEQAGSVQDAITVALNNGAANTILVGPGTYSDGPYDLDGSAAEITLRGSGEGVTTLTAPASLSPEFYVVAYNANVQNLSIALNATNSSGDRALSLDTSTADHVAVTAPGTTNVMGIVGSQSTVSHASIQLPFGGGTTGIQGSGNMTVSDTSITADYGFKHSSAAASDGLSRVRISADVRGVSTDVGDIDVDDTLIDLGTAPGARGISVENLNNSAASKTVTANHVTIVGGGAGSYGVYAYAARATALQQSTAFIGNSIVRGPATDLYAVAGNDGAEGGTSTATIALLYSDWHSQSAVSQPNGSATIAVGTGRLDVDPGFRDAAHGNYRLAPGSPLVDKGMPGTSGLSLDLDGSPRLQDGNSDGTAVRDLGAYELAPAAPDTTAPGTAISSHPKKRVTKRRVTFGFTSDEASVTFQCKLDGKAWRSCTSPTRYRVTRGLHRFQVRAIDAAHNVDATPATFRFRRV